MSFGCDIMRCCMIWYAHLMAAVVGLSVSDFLESEGGGGVSIDSLTSIAKRTASFWVVYAYSNMRAVML